MIDIHCHFLPGIDDGPDALEESLALARLAVDNGIKKTVVTPHIQPGRYENDKVRIAESFHLFKTALKNENIKLELGMAAEVRISTEMITMIAENRIPYLGEVDGYKIILLEFPHSHILPGSDRLVNYLLKQNIRPLIAHPERNKDVIRKLEKIEPFVDMGCWLQLTAGSICGHFGPEAKQRADEILESGWAKVIATDSHDISNRPPILAEGFEAASRIIGHDIAEKLVIETPDMIVNSQFG